MFRCFTKQGAGGARFRHVFQRLLLVWLISGAALMPALAAGERPRIGVALSGGGARGAAHVGVLKALEAMRVPVDCIAGTSMGAIVGGAYAAGTSVEGLENAIIETDWADIFNDRPPRSEQPLRRKAEVADGLSEIELGLGEQGIAIAAGLVSGVQIENFLRRLTRPSADVHDFSRLPIPFRALATDIETGEAVLLQSGSLSRALRASMAIPGAMAPVEIDGQLLVDGGIADNLPIQVVRELCADIVIAVNIQSPLLKRDELNSAFSITAQLINLLGKTSVDAQIASLSGQDVLIQPELGDLSAADFERQLEALQIGESAALAKHDSLSRLSLPEDQYAVVRSRQRVSFAGLGVVDAIQFEGLRHNNPAMLMDQLSSQPGASLDEEVLAADMRRIYGSGDFESVDYRIRDTERGRTLIITPREKRWGPGFLGFGLGLAADFRGDSAFGALLQYRRSGLNALGGEAVARLRFGRENRVSAEIYQPLDGRERYFVSAAAAGGLNKQSFFVGDDRIASYNVRTTQVGLRLGRNLGRYGQISIGPEWERVRFSRDTGSVLLPNLRDQIVGLRLSAEIDQLDSAWLPSRGYAWSLDVIHASETEVIERFTRLETRGQVALSRGTHTLALDLRLGTDFDSDQHGFRFFSLGGPMQLSAYPIGALQGNHYTFARLDYRRRTARLPSILGSGVFAGAALEVGKMDNLLGSNQDSGLRHSVSVYLAVDSALGPAYLGAALGDDGRKSLFMLLGLP